MTLQEALEFAEDDYSVESTDHEVQVVLAAAVRRMATLLRWAAPFVRLWYASNPARTSNMTDEQLAKLETALEELDTASHV